MDVLATLEFAGRLVGRGGPGIKASSPEWKAEVSEAASDALPDKLQRLGDSYGVP